LKRVVEKIMKSILSIAAITAGLMTLAVTSVHAENADSGITHPNSGKLQWLQMADDLSAGEYKHLYHPDKRDLRSAARISSESTAESTRLTRNSRELAAGATELAAGLLIRQDVTFELNSKNSFTFEVRDPAEKDRVLLLSYRMQW
jgi:hypothetical protein